MYMYMYMYALASIYVHTRHAHTLYMYLHTNQEPSQGRLVMLLPFTACDRSHTHIIVSTRVWLLFLADSMCSYYLEDAASIQIDYGTH